MLATNIQQPVQTYEFTRDEVIEASIDIVFEAVLDELGPESQMPDGKPFPMRIEPWPGGRWFRDLGNNTGHHWGQVQVIKPPALLELSGPMFMSYPAINHLQYRLIDEGGATRLRLTHKAIGLIPDDHLRDMEMGWGYKVQRISELAMQRKTTNRKE